MKLIPALGSWILIAATVGTLMAAETVLVPANSPVAVYEGRTAQGPGGTVGMGFPGVTLHLRFRGSALSMRVAASKDDNLFDLSVDGSEPALLRVGSGQGDYALIQGGSTGDHVVELTRRNEGWRGTCSIVGFLVGEGSLLPPAALPARKLMFIGDSVTCGELTAWSPGADPKAAVNSDARLSYGMILARRIGAQCHLVSYGGRGVIRDWQGIEATNNAPQFYELAMPDDPATTWDASGYVPEAIGIQLGTNDFGEGIPDQNAFVNAYVEFIRKVRRDAPRALIFVMDSPIVRDEPLQGGHGGPRGTVLHAYLEEVVRRAGSPRVILAPLGHSPGVPGNGHPTGADHRVIADELEPVLRRALGW
jgi:hypothetical protein